MRNSLRVRTACPTFVLAVILLLAAILPLAPAGATAGPSLSYTVTPQAYNNTVHIGPSDLVAEPRIAVGPDPATPGQEDVYVVGLSNPYDNASCGYGHSLIVFRSADGGLSFGSPAMGSVCYPGNRVDAVVLPDGTLVVSVPGPQILLSRDGGATWTTAHTFSTWATYSSLTIDNATGTLYLVWSNATADYTPGSLEVASSRDGGRTWGSPVCVLRDCGSGLAPTIAAWAGHVVVAFQSDGGAVPSVAMSVDAGATWSAADSLGNPDLGFLSASPPSATVSSAGVFALVWQEETNPSSPSGQVLAVLSRDGGSTWSTPFSIGAPYNPAPPDVGDIAVFDNQGRLFVAMLSYAANYSGPLPQAFLTVANSTQSLGAFSSSSFAVSFQTMDDANGTRAENLAVDSAGRVFLTWVINTNPFTTGGYSNASDVGLFVRTVTGAATGNVLENATAGLASATVSLRSSVTGNTVRQAAWTGQTFLLPELPPDQYQVWIDRGQGLALAGTIPIRPWSRTAFTVYASGIGNGPPPRVPFPWLLPSVLAAGLILFGAALAVLHYTRLTRETVLRRKARLLLYEYIREHPGASFSAVRDAIDLQNGAASYHLEVLEGQGFVHSERKGHRRFYYPNGNASLWRDLPLSEIQSSILQAVRAAPGVGVRELSRTIRRKPSSVTDNVKALAREGLLRTDRDGLRVRCYPADGTVPG